jgi:hypothetical protein
MFYAFLQNFTLRFPNYALNVRRRSPYIDISGGWVDMNLFIREETTL